MYLFLFSFLSRLNIKIGELTIAISVTMHILVLHHSLNSAGGGERVCIHLLKLLCDYMKLDVMLGTTEPVDWDYVERMLGVRLENRPRTTSILPFRLRAFGIYYRPVTGLHVLRLRKYVNLTINTHGDVMVVPADVVYLHFPVLAYMKIGYLRPYLKYYRSLFWRIYFEPYRQLQERHARSIFSKATLILTNSKFSAHFIEELFHREAIVVYPPVEVEQYLKLRNHEDRDYAVIYVARFSLEKNQHIVPYIAREMPHVKFYLVGTVAGRGREYFLYVKKLVEKLNVKNVELMPNLPHEEKLRLLAKCRVYLHLMITEHFGIAPVEAMSAGLTLIVPKLSGTWTDVCDFGRYGLGFSSLNVAEIASLLEEALSRWRKLQAPAEHVLRFSVQNFYRSMQCIMSELLNEHYK